jgi:hypothetical protein
LMQWEVNNLLNKTAQGSAIVTQSTE